MMDKESCIEDEVLIITNSGEIPEIAYHNSLYHMVKDPEGPQLVLSEDDLLPLQRAVHGRYRRIILRDLNPAYRDKRIFRGLQRCIANWRRLCNFCDKTGLDTEPVRHEVIDALQQFMGQEYCEVQSGERRSCINCTEEALVSFCAQLGLSDQWIDSRWKELCLVVAKD